MFDTTALVLSLLWRHMLHTQMSITTAALDYALRPSSGCICDDIKHIGACCFACVLLAPCVTTWEPSYA